MEGFCLGLWLAQKIVSEIVSSLFLSLSRPNCNYKETEGSRETCSHRMLLATKLKLKFIKRVLTSTKSFLRIGTQKS
jgi:hypothetical protein